VAKPKSYDDASDFGVGVGEWRWGVGVEAGHVGAVRKKHAPASSTWLTPGRGAAKPLEQARPL